MFACAFAYCVDVRNEFAHNYFPCQNQYAHVDPYEVFRSANSLCAQPGPATDSCERRRRLAGMLALMTTLSSLLVCRFRSRAALELQIVALRHQLGALRRQRPGRPTLTSLDRLLWVWLYRVWPHCLKVMVQVKSATVV
jgi:hypothetical protein